MKLLKLIFALFLLLNISYVTAQVDEKEEKKDEFTIGVEIRPRTEFNHGNKMPETKYIIQDEYKYPGVLSTNQRSRLNLDYKSEKVKFGLVLQDVRTWGNQKQLVANEDLATSVHQAWAEVFFTKKLSLKAGRMELAYDDHRILGSVGWAPQARSHDLALFKYEGTLKVHLGFAYHGGPYNGPDAYKSMQYLWINGKAGDLGYSALVLNNGLTERGYWYGTMVEEKNAFSQTLGARLTYKITDLSFAFNAYYQTGKKAADWLDLNSLPTGESLDDYNTDNGTSYTDGPNNGQSISSYNFSVEAMYKINDNVKAGLAYEMLSGNDLTDLNRTDENAFMPLYGTNHKFNGWMDYFYVGNHASNVGLQDINAKILMKFDKFFIKLIPHYFMPAGKTEYIDNDGNLQSLGSLGTEIDIWAGYQIVPKVASIEIGYSHLIPTESMYGLKYGISPASSDFGMNNWAWIMLNIKPKWNFYRDKCCKTE